MKPIYNEKGIMIDVSDEGEQARQVEKDIDLRIRLKREPKRIQEIAKLIREGHSYKEIGEIMGLTETNVQQILYRNRLKCNPKA